MRSERILVVDDEKKIVENISLCLEREGFQTIGTHTGDDAVKICGQKKFDLVLLDVSMPGMNGYEAMDHIFGLDEDVLVIIITGNASVESAIRALKIGAWDYLKKPFEYAELIKTVKNALQQKKLIAEKKAVSERLRASELQYEHIVNNSPDLIFTLDRNGCFTFVNYQFEQALGYSGKDLIGIPFEKILHREDIEKATILLKSGVQNSQDSGGRGTHFRFRKAVKKKSRYDPDRSFAHMELKASPMYLPASEKRDEFNGVYAVARDMTDRLNLEDQLRQAQKMEAIGTLAGGIAHDFNNILMGIQGYASLVKASFDNNTDEYKRLASIDEYVFNGAEMTKQLLGFAQKSCRKTYLINLNYLIKMSATMFGRTKKDVWIEQSLDKGLWSTVVDEGQVKQVMMNLFVNACQAMPDGGKLIIKSENVTVPESGIDELGLEKSGNYVGITVTDTGIGMDENTVGRVFDPFFTTKEIGKGTGLGLATAYGIIKGHKGAFKVISTPGQGSSFTFFLPASQKTRVDVLEVPAEKDVISSGKGTILLVDDEEGVLKVCAEMLKSLGYNVKKASTGMAAIRIVKSGEERIDLVILDIVMPLMNGIETFEKIRTIDPEMKILLCSGFKRKEDIKKTLDKGLTDFILKPYDVASLSEKLSRVLS